MKVIHISDTHCRHKGLTDLPKGDILVHSGDCTNIGNEAELLDFLYWFCDLEGYQYKLFIGGNHDHLLYRSHIEGLPKNCHYLCHSSVEIEGIKFYGLPMFPEDEISGYYTQSIASIPKDTDVLISHQPPYGILDFADGVHYGDGRLLAQVLRRKPRFHLFGHIHSAYGLEKGQYTTFVNSATWNEDTETMQEAQSLLLEKDFF